MKLYVGVTDDKWFQFLASRQPDEVNFWKPGGNVAFRALDPGAPFLFKLHSPHNFIVGGGFFVSYAALPLGLAWESFREKNGVQNLSQFREAILHYRKTDRDSADPVIGCIVLSSPFFLPRDEWIPVPSDWSANLVQGKTYETTGFQGASLWASVQQAIEHTQATNVFAEAELPMVCETQQRYGSEFLTRGRLGQGAFRVLVTEAYSRRCAVTGERTLPALEAAHIKPFEESGPNRTRNGLLLRADLHKLFDRGLVTVTPDYRVEVSPSIKEEYENGREYYKLHGNRLVIVPRPPDSPDTSYLQWHNENCYRR